MQSEHHMRESARIMLQLRDKDLVLREIADLLAGLEKKREEIEELIEHFEEFSAVLQAVDPPDDVDA